MRRASLCAAVAVVLIANAFALVHAWRNRSGPVDTDITLTERELPMSYTSSEDDSGVSLDVRWLNPGWAWSVFGRRGVWLDQNTLRELGFDTSVAASDPKAAEFYQRQRARRAYVALEYDGPSWQKHLQETELQNQQQAKLAQMNIPPHSHEGETHLIAVDASIDPARLRARHPDRNSVIIVPAVVRIAAEPLLPAIGGQPAQPARLSGTVQEIPTSIHVPRPFSDAFRQKDRARVHYRVHLRYGVSHEPWIAGVDFSDSRP